ncbi:cruzipain precursor, putative [Trypanosoma cruzi marinkellei]|uniref:Cruzipain, putative n=1 Tax=Trypanosoma cruzi marinkellei TaxID=85056 RepID=K2MXG8_TRYCR|nr:cruzipain precursor, putative [Trypanosoma cruzi marinkellei]
MNSLSARLLIEPLIRHGILADERALITQHGNRDMIGSAPQEGQNTVAERNREHFRKASGSTTAPPAREPGHHGAHAGPAGRQLPEFPRMGARAAKLHEESNQRPPQMAPIPPIGWGTERDTPRAFYLAPARAKAMHGIGAWCGVAFPASRSTPDSAQYGACENCCRNPERQLNGGCRVGSEAAAPPPTRCRRAAPGKRSDARRVVVLCGLVPPPSATRSAPPEHHMAPSWPCAPRFGQGLAARGSSPFPRPSR